MLTTQKIFIDLNLILRYVGVSSKGAANERRKNCFRPGYGILANVRIPQMCRAIPWRLQGVELYLPRPISMHGFCAIDISRKSSRYPGLLALKAKQTVSHEHPRKSITQYSVECQQSARMAHLCRSCNDFDPQGTRTLYQRFLRNRSGQHGLCPGFNNHRFVPVSFSMGTFSKEQGRYQTSYAPGSARTNPLIYQYYRRKCRGCKRLGHPDLRSRFFLYHGPRVHRFQKTLQNASAVGIFCDTRQVQHQMPQTVLAAGRQINWPALRSNDCSDAIVRRLSGKTPSRKILRRGERFTVDVFNQQFFNRCLDYRSALKMPLESGTVFQMDQTAPADQSILWHIRERRKNSSLDSRLGLRPDCDYQKAAISGTVALYDSTDFEC